MLSLAHLDDGSGTIAAESNTDTTQGPITSPHTGIDGRATWVGANVVKRRPEDFGTLLSGRPVFQGAMGQFALCDKQSAGGTDELRKARPRKAEMWTVSP